MRVLASLAVVVFLSPLVGATLGDLQQQQNPGVCVSPPGLPCIAWHDAGPSPAPGDDGIYLHQGIEDAIFFLPYGTPTGIDLQNATVPTDVFRRYHDLDQTLDAATPAPVNAWFDLDIDEAASTTARR